jgi:hypothetical protein
MKWVGYEAGMHKMEIRNKFWFESLTERDRSEGVGVDS